MNGGWGPIDDLDEPVELPSRFDYDEWLESVQGQTIEVTTPDGYPNIARCYYMPPWTGISICYCEDCDKFSNFVTVEENGNPIGRCPLCGKEPGLLEVGTSIPDRFLEVADGCSGGDSQ